MGDITPFDFNGAEVRVMDQSGEPWWFAQDVAAILGYSATGAMNKLIDEDDRRIEVFQVGTTYQKQSLINESGLYAAIFGSTLDGAKAE